MTSLFEMASEEWIDFAICAQTDPELFFPEKGGSTRSPKSVCETCDVRAACLTYAVENNERFGIWGGYSERDRRKLHDPGALDAALAAMGAPPRPTTTTEEYSMPTITAPARDSIEVTDYVADMARILSRTEGHPDKLVRDVRKLAVQALQALATATTATAAPAPKPAAATAVVPKPSTGRGNVITQRLEALGVTAADVRAWAADNDIHCSPRGNVRSDVLDAYEAAHPQAA